MEQSAIMTQAPHLEQLNLTPEVTQVSRAGAVPPVHAGHSAQVGRGGHQATVTTGVSSLRLLVLQLEPEAAE